MADVVPRAWTHLLGIVSGEPLDPKTETPLAWRETLGRYAPTVMTDGGDVAYQDFSNGYSPSSRIDQAIIATRNAVFPELGLDPSF